MSPMRDEPASRACSNIRPRRSPTSARKGVAAGRRARRSTWARAPSWSSAATRTRPAARFGVDRRRARASSTRAPAGGSSTSRHRDRAARSGPRRRSTRAGFWDEFDTDWVLPRLRADALVGQGAGAAAPPVRRRRRRRARGAAGRRSPCSTTRLRERRRRWRAAGADRAARQRVADRYVDAYRRYCWPVDSLDDLQLAPFHLLATEGRVHIDQDHVWHMETLARALRGRSESLLLATPYRRGRPDRRRRARRRRSRWWEELTGARRRRHGRQAARLHRARHAAACVQPAVKCRGREYLRIIYGPEYTAPENLERLR